MHLNRPPDVAPCTATEAAKPESSNQQALLPSGAALFSPGAALFAKLTCPLPGTEACATPLTACRSVGVLSETVAPQSSATHVLVHVHAFAAVALRDALSIMCFNSPTANSVVCIECLGPHLELGAISCLTLGFKFARQAGFRPRLRVVFAPMLGHVARLRAAFTRLPCFSRSVHAEADPAGSSWS